MITAHEAIDIARRELISLFEINDVQVEEYALDRNRPFWLVTLSYIVDSDERDLGLNYDVLAAIPRRKWKTVSINNETGLVDAVVSGSAWELIK